MSQDMAAANLPIGNRANRMPLSLRVEVVTQILVFGICRNRIRGDGGLDNQKEKSEKWNIKKAALPPAFDLGPWTFDAGRTHHIPNRFP